MDFIINGANTFCAVEVLTFAVEPDDGARTLTWAPWALGIRHDMSLMTSRRAIFKYGFDCGIEYSGGCRSCLVHMLDILAALLGAGSLQEEDQQQIGLFTNLANELASLVHRPLITLDRTTSGLGFEFIGGRFSRIAGSVL